MRGDIIGYAIRLATPLARYQRVVIVRGGHASSRRNSRIRADGFTATPSRSPRRAEHQSFGSDFSQFVDVVVALAAGPRAAEAPATRNSCAAGIRPSFAQPRSDDPQPRPSTTPFAVVAGDNARQTIRYPPRHRPADHAEVLAKAPEALESRAPKSDVGAEIVLQRLGLIGGARIRGPRDRVLRASPIAEGPSHGGGGMLQRGKTIPHAASRPRRLPLQRASRPSQYAIGGRVIIEKKNEIAARLVHGAIAREAGSLTWLENAAEWETAARALGGRLDNAPVYRRSRRCR